MNVKVAKPEEYNGKAFKHLLAWNKLNHHPKFQPNPEGSSASDDCSIGKSMQSDQILDEASSAGASRPKGRKRSKLERLSPEAEKKRKTCDEVLRLQRQRNEALDKHNDILLFQNCSADDPDAKDFFAMLRKEAVLKARLRLSEQATETSNEE